MIAILYETQKNRRKKNTQTRDHTGLFKRGAYIYELAYTRLNLIRVRSTIVSAPRDYTINCRLARGCNLTDVILANGAMLRARNPVAVADKFIVRYLRMPITGDFRPPNFTDFPRII